METLSSQERKQLEQVEGVIFDIQRYSTHDGPGLRTDVFLKGCPLRCGWCSNPESQHPQPELALFANQCVACNQFAEACPVHWKQERNNGWNKELEDKYNARAAVCPTAAIHRIGAQRTAGEVIKEVLRDLPFYEDGGGMTLTGGEPTMQPDMAEALLRLAKAEGISTAMETCGHAQWEVFERLLPYLDHILFDIKHLDSQIHHAYTGVGNELILANLHKLIETDAPITIRVPLIPGFNATPAYLQAITGFVQELDPSISSLDILPYHTLGRSKYTALGHEYPWNRYARFTEKELEHLTNVAESYGLIVNIGG